MSIHNIEFCCIFVQSEHPEYGTNSIYTDKIWEKLSKILHIACTLFPYYTNYIQHIIHLCVWAWHFIYMQKVFVILCYNIIMYKYDIHNYICT